MKKKVMVKNPSKPEAVQLYTIQKGVPLPRRSDSHGIAELKDKIKKLAKSMEPMDCFVIPGAQAHTAQKFLRETFTARVFRVVATDKSKKFARIYLIK